MGKTALNLIGLSLLLAGKAATGQGRDPVIEGSSVDASAVVTAGQPPANNIGEIGQPYHIDRDKFVFTFIGLDYLPSRCADFPDRPGIMLCGRDSEPVPMTLVRYRVKNTGPRPLTLNNSHVQFTLVDAEGRATRQLGYQQLADSARRVPKMPPGGEVELWTIIDAPREPAPVELHARFRSDEILTFDLSATPDALARPVEIDTSMPRVAPQGGFGNINRMPAEAPADAPGRVDPAPGFTTGETPLPGPEASARTPGTLRIDFGQADYEGDVCLSDTDGQLGGHTRAMDGHARTAG